MRYQSLVLATLVAVTCANPVQLSKRKEEVYDKDGNLKVQFSKQTVKVGDISLDDIFDKLGDACNENLCETNDITIKGQIHTSDTTDNIELTLGPTGSYKTDLRKKLFEAWKAVVKEVAKCEEVTNDPPCPNPQAFCPSKFHTYTQCEVPQYWGVIYNKGDNPPNMQTDLEVEVSDDKLCEDLLGGLSGVAGAVNGAAGGFFTLLSFACT
ncbi:hypothetical protein K505DRAFT_239631 [Melanomma pulvis-pyrius CBS 109.77]|uniref:Uncharacterized protein n=1 Tax=Melanomma pulvis-pyrius CBS 109.77 TaxID=1314802 RepID=A0A6A6XGH6_9PLEO|nr:hypothetical protein K505DRAFT_239631 [Melanomma pulvis-pyrius CBS 109.77]